MSSAEEDVLKNKRLCKIGSRIWDKILKKQPPEVFYKKRCSSKFQNFPKGSGKLCEQRKILQ